MGHAGGPSDVGVPIERADPANVLAIFEPVTEAEKGTGFRGPFVDSQFLP
jgi:hypothetical protein